jgi:putative transposase
VSRRFVAQSETALARLLAADLSSPDSVAIMVDGVHSGEPTCVVPLGIGMDDSEYLLSLVEGSTENSIEPKSPPRLPSVQSVAAP